MPKLCCKVLSNFRQAEIFQFKLYHLVIFSVISDFHSLWWYVCSSISHVNDLSRYERTFSKRNIVAYCAFVSLYHTAPQFLKPMHVWKLNSSVFWIEFWNRRCKDILQRGSWRARMSFLLRLFLLLKGNVLMHSSFRAVKSAKGSDIELSITGMKWSMIQIDKHSLVFLYRFSPKMILVINQWQP